MAGYEHMCIAIPPKHPVASVIGYLKGEIAIAIARLGGKERHFSGEHFWARGYAVSTLGFELEQVRKYIRGQEEGAQRATPRPTPQPPLRQPDSSSHPLGGGCLTAQPVEVLPRSPKHEYGRASESDSERSGTEYVIELLKWWT